MTTTPHDPGVQGRAVIDLGRQVRELRAERDALLKAAPAWEPIKTAPSGEEIVLYFPPEPHRAQLVRVDFYPPHYPRKPTHWLPLPALPALAAQEADRG